MSLASERLPQIYIPKSYDLYLHIVEGTCPFDASVAITFQKTPNIDDDKIYLSIDKTLKIKKVSQNNINLRFQVSYPILIIYQSKVQEFDFTTYPITIEYSILPNRNQRFGFYMNNGNYLTDFEPCGARQLLPCYDEPFVRSIFSVKLLIPSQLTALSNMPIKSINKLDNENEVTFFPTPAMSSYLLCICVGHFASIYGSTKGGIFVEYFTSPGREKYLKKYLDVAIFSLDWLESKLHVKYELPHLQLISLSGLPPGMENYGLITLPDYTSSNKYFTSKASVIMHEIVHQWFGDLVCIKYWDSLWLNEGFAEFIQYLILRDFNKKLDVFKIFAEEEGKTCLDYYDEGVLVEKESELNLNYLFGHLTYSKGAFVVKMFYDMIGEEKFFYFCESYLNQYKNKSVDISDFVSCVNNTLNEDFTSFFDAWLKNFGFPTLIVKEIEYNQKFVALEITQTSKSGCIFTLKVPIIYEKDGEVKKMEFVIDKKESHIDLEFDWLMVNDMFSSLCFVILSKKLLTKLIEIKDKINETNKKFIYGSLNNEYAHDIVDDDMIEMTEELFK